jgi:hypothetical protein
MNDRCEFCGVPIDYVEREFGACESCWSRWADECDAQSQSGMKAEAQIHRDLDAEDICEIS